ncbi:MAG: hypothetical protein IPK16_31090 [Anaerolineales bacterium]|nr:hypothetical protein [Anaerolineales bacterium]
MAANVWIGPEIQYGVRDRTDFWNSLVVQPAMDPGAFVLQEQPAVRQIRLTQMLALDAYNLATGVKRLTYESVIRPVDNPLRTLPQVDELMAGIRFAGYEQRITLAEVAADAILAEVWNLIAVNPGGVLLFPTTPGIAPVDYFEPVDAAHQTIDAHHVRLKITGERRYKVGYPAVHTLGRIAYFNALSPDRSYLLVRCFFNNPSSHYADEPPTLPGRSGSSLHVYNDGGGFGGFGEIECNGQAIGARTERTQSADQFILWLFAGPAARLRQISLRLVGVDPHEE